MCNRVCVCVCVLGRRILHVLFISIFSAEQKGREQGSDRFFDIRIEQGKRRFSRCRFGAATSCQSIRDFMLSVPDTCHPFAVPENLKTPPTSTTFHSFSLRFLAVLAPNPDICILLNGVIVHNIFLYTRTNFRISILCGFRSTMFTFCYGRKKRLRDEYLGYLTITKLKGELLL